MHFTFCHLLLIAAFNIVPYCGYVTAKARLGRGFKLPVSDMSVLTDGSLQKISIAAVIFDLDGTLLDTETLSTQSIQMVLDRFNCEFTWALKERSLGQRGDMWSCMVVDELKLKGKLEPSQLIQEWEENLSELCCQVEKMAGAECLVQTFKALGDENSSDVCRKSSTLYLAIFLHLNNLFTA